MRLRNLFASLVVGSMLLVGGAFAQVGVGIQFGHRSGVGVEVGVPIEVGVPPSCEFGYYDYEPYACAPEGFYGDGYFYNGIFLGVGPWGGWGYNHGWGDHRFSGEGRGGSYRGNAGRNAHQNGMRGGRGNGGRGGNRGGGGHKH